MGNGGGRDIWLLTSNPGSLISNNIRGTLEKGCWIDKRSAHIDQDRGGEMQMQHSTAHWIKLGDTKTIHLSENPSVTLLSNSQTFTKIVKYIHVCFSFLSLITKASNGVGVGLSLQQGARLLRLAFLVVTQPETLNSNRIWGDLPASHNRSAV